MEIHANSKTFNSKFDTYVIVCMRDTHSLGAIAQMQVQYNIKRGPYLCNPLCHLWRVKMHNNKSRHVIIDSRVKLSPVIYQYSATFRINWKKIETLGKWRQNAYTFDVGEGGNYCWYS